MSVSREDARFVRNEHISDIALAQRKIEIGPPVSNEDMKLRHIIDKPFVRYMDTVVGE